DYSVAIHVASPTTRKHPILRHECGMRIAVAELAIQGVPIGGVNLPVAVAITPQRHSQFVDRFPGDEQQIALWPLGDVDDRPRLSLDERIFIKQRTAYEITDVIERLGDVGG